MAIDPSGISAKKSNFITRSIQKANALLETITDLQQMTEEATIEGYATSIVDADFVGDNNHIDKATLVAFFGASQAIVALLEANSNANFKKLYDMKR